MTTSYEAVNNLVNLIKTDSISDFKDEFRTYFFNKFNNNSSIKLFKQSFNELEDLKNSLAKINKKFGE
jgi:hypothetical protein|nr:MAG TPA: hypothetical protein [Caudoviricetes sp.]DAX27532.1 MAG TPA: hypothetical protein [Caudoviricetes sp.]